MLWIIIIEAHRRHICNNKINTVMGTMKLMIGLSQQLQNKLCKEHYKEFKKATKKDRKLEKWRHQDSR